MVHEALSRLWPSPADPLHRRLTPHEIARRLGPAFCLSVPPALIRRLGRPVLERLAARLQKQGAARAA